MNNVDHALQAGYRPTGHNKPVSVAAIQHWLIENVSQLLKVQPAEIDISLPFKEYGLTSTEAVSLSGELEEFLERKLPHTLIYDYPTITRLAQHLAGLEEHSEPITAKQTPDKPSDAPDHIQDEAIAIIGMACRFPGGANTPEDFWQTLKQGASATTEIPSQRWNIDDYYDPSPDTPGKMYTRYGCFLEDLELFDASFFGLSPRETIRMDPQHRLLMEVSWEAMENAGLAVDSLAGSQTGVFIGMMNNFEYTRLQINQGDGSWIDDPYFGTGSASSMVSGRLAYLFDFRGPTLTVDTACSSSLVSLHLACQSLRNNECTLALVGGVNTLLGPENVVNACKMGMLAADGHCKTFDASADGFVLGEGCGIVLLKRLSQAHADGNPILAVVRGSAVNQDGRSNGITAPNKLAQEAVIRSALERANVTPERVSYVEAHGSGTALGDPIEMAALESVLGKERSQQLMVGTVKTNIGHLAGAAGIAGLIKTVLALQYREIPPHLNLHQLNPHIPPLQPMMMIPTKLTPWQVEEHTRIAGVSSFSWSGTNAHVILEEAPPTASLPASSSSQMLVLSARTASALETMLANLRTHLQNTPEVELAELAFTLQIGRKAFEHRYMQISSSVTEATGQLEKKQGITTCKEARTRRTAFLFPGQEAPYRQMGLGLYTSATRFRTEIDHCIELLKPYGELDIRAILSPLETELEAAAQPLQSSAIAQTALFVIEYALAKQWMEWGVYPQSMFGQGIGEYVAACLAGVFSLADALVLVTVRGRLRMLEQDTSCQPVHVSYTQMPDPILEQFTALVQSTPLHAPEIPYLSNFTGNWITEQEATDPAYWIRHARMEENLVQGIEMLFQESESILLEVGPEHSLTTVAKQHPARKPEQMILASLHQSQSPETDYSFLLTTCGTLWCAGASLRWAAFHAAEQRHQLSLPTYPFERKRYWITPSPSEPSAPTAGEKRAVSTTVAKKTDSGDWFYKVNWQQSPLQPLAEQTQTVFQPWLIFMDETGPGEPLANYLERLGHTVIRVLAGKEFRQLNPTTFSLRSDQSDDYTMLCQMLVASDRMPQITLHCWNVAAEMGATSRSEHFQNQQSKGFYSLLSFVQALEREAPDRPQRLLVLASQMQCVTGQEILQPEKAPLLGICRVIPQEYSQIACCSIDLDIPEAGTWQDAIELRQIVAESSRALSDLSIAYRNKTRLVQTYQPCHLEASLPLLSQRGVYLITGGLGNIALLLAEYLAKTVQARLVLVGRSTLPQRISWNAYGESLQHDKATLRKIQRIQSIEAQGSEVLLMQADVADEAQMQAVIDQVYKRFGSLNGVIHTAGIVTKTAFKALQQMGRTECEIHFQPKVYGTFALERVLQDHSLDFCLLFSSLSVVLGGLGFAAYSASNAFLDAFAHRHNQLSTTPWLSVNWDGWPSTIATSGTPGGTPGDLVMTEQEAWDAFARVLASGQTHLAHSTGDLSTRIEQWLRPEPAQQTIFDSQPRTATTARSIPSRQVFSRADYEQKITAIWQQVLGIEEIRPDDNFFDIGGNSLLTLEVIAKLKKAFQKHIPAIVLFEAPTISALVSYLHTSQEAEKEHPQTTPSESSTQAKTQDTTRESIAVIGMAGRFPGAATVDEFWQNLRNGRESITFFSEQELLAAGVSPTQLNNPKYVKARPILEDADLFDAAFFDYSPREAELMDPQHRLFLECSWEALEHASYDPSRYSGSIGVYAGANLSTYLLALMAEREILAQVNDYQVVIGNDKDSLTTTVSYKLNLRGPSFAVQTFCSTSLVAIHLACQSLRRGECHMAIAGGVSVRVPWKVGYVYEEGGMESPDGHCRTFDAQARGSLFGDGVAAVVLKPLSQALADGDTIHAVIKGSAVNNDGSLKVSYTAPSVVGQSEVVTAALQDAGVEAESISYIEAHGTATSLGDPIEVAALTKAFRSQTDRRGYCAIGSAKTNVGHLDRAAGVTGLIKTVQALREREIPASLHYQSPNPEIDFMASPFYVNTQLTRWASTGEPRRAGVSSLGMGGTNAHVIVEEAPELFPSGPSRAWQLLVLSARTSTALETASKNLCQYLQSHKDIPLADIAWTLQVGRKQFEHRRLMLCRTHEEAIRMLENPENPPVLDRIGKRVDRPVAFLFHGVGEYSMGMAEEIYRQERIFREIVDHCCTVLQPLLQIDLRQVLFKDTPSYTHEVHSFPGQNGKKSRQGGLATITPLTDELAQPAMAHPSIFVIEYAMAQLLIHWGISPQALLGYSLGEYVAACIAGIFSLEDALTLVAQRAQLMQGLPGGAMLAVALSEEEVQPYINERVSLAIINAPRTCVLAGPVEDMQQLEARLISQGIAQLQIETTHAFHTGMLKPLQEALTACTRKIQLHPPRIPCLSNVTGTWITDEQATDPAYWVQQMCQTVRFADNIAHLLQETETVLLEVGPGQTLSSFVKQHTLCENERMSLLLTTFPLPMERRSEYEYLLLTLGKLWLTGVTINWQRFCTHERRRRVPLPSYPFERRRYWLESRTQPGSKAPVSSEAPTRILKKEVLADWFYVPGWKSAMRPPLQNSEQAQEAMCQLVLLDTCGIGAQIAQRLHNLGGDVITVHHAQGFARIDGTNYTVNPVERSDYALLFASLQECGKKVQQIAHLWSIGEAGQAIDDALHLGLYSLIALAQALGDSELEHCQVRVISNDTQVISGQEQISPARIALTGSCRVLSQEYPNVQWSNIDILLPPHGSQQEDEILQQLSAEITASEATALVALRANRRWLPCFESIHIEPVERQRLPLSAGNVYIITGGLGGIGLALASFLAREYQAKLVLIGRTGLPTREQWDHTHLENGTGTDGEWRIQQVRNLEASGAQVLVIQADVRCEEEMRAAVKQAQEHFGAIHGVFHTAGVPGIGLTQFKTQEQVCDVLGPKVDGTLVLEKVLADKEIELLVLFSSIASQMGGGPGQIDYSAANAFLAAYALSQKRGKRRVVVIDWGEWQWNAWGTGLNGYDARIQAFLKENRQRCGIAFEEGMEALKRVLATDLSHVIVSTQNFPAKIEESEQLTTTYLAQQIREKYPRPELVNSYMPPRNDREQRIVALWETLLGTTPVGINDNFFELGGNSLTGIDLIARLRGMFHLKTLATYMLYEAPTVSKMALYIEQGKSDEEVKERLERGEKRRESRNRHIHEIKRTRRQSVGS